MKLAVMEDKADSKIYFQPEQTNVPKFVCFFPVLIFSIKI